MRASKVYERRHIVYIYQADKRRVVGFSCRQFIFEMKYMMALASLGRIVGLSIGRDQIRQL